MSNIEAEMARFEEEISTDNEKSNEEFKPPPLPPIMPPPMFLPHSLQSGNRQSLKDKKTEEDSSSKHGAQTVDQTEPCNQSPSGQEPKLSSFNMAIRPQNQLVPNTGAPNMRLNNSGAGSFGPNPINPMPPVSMGLGPMRPLGLGPIGPRPIGGPMQSNMLGPNTPLNRPMLSGPIRPPINNNIQGPMPPPMPSFFPPPVLPDFLAAGRQQQTTYSSAPVLKKKSSEKKKAMKSTTSIKTKKVEKVKVKKKEKEVVLPATDKPSDDRLSEIGPEAGPHVGRPPLPMQHHTFASQPPLYGLSPLAGNPQMAKAASQASLKKKKIIRTAAGQKWDDPSLLEWDSNDYRIFCGDLGNEVTDDTLARIFSKYSSFQKARVVREKNSKKSKGYGFVSFKDPNDFIRAMREINGKYVGNRPIKLRKSNWKDRNVDVVRKKVKEKKKLGYKV